MPYKISWHDTNTMLVEVFGEVTAEDFLKITAESFALVEAANSKIDAIVDQSQAISLPLNLRVLVDSIPRNRHANQGMTILLIPKMNKLGRFAASTMLQILGLEYRIAQNLDEAKSILQKRHVSL